MTTSVQGTIYVLTWDESPKQAMKRTPYKGETMRCAPNDRKPEWSWSHNRLVKVNQNFIEYIKIEEKKDRMGLPEWHVIASLHSLSVERPVTCILARFSTFPEAQAWLGENFQ